MSQADFRCLTISATEGHREMNERGKYHRVYRVQVQSDATGKKSWFIFHASEADEQAGKIGLGPDELLWAFRCFVDDGIAGDQPFKDFCADFGYDDDSLTAHRAWKACREASRKLKSLFHNEVDAFDILAELSEMGVE